MNRAAEADVAAALSLFGAMRAAGPVPGHCTPTAQCVPCTYVCPNNPPSVPCIGCGRTARCVAVLQRGTFSFRTPSDPNPNGFLWTCEPCARFANGATKPEPSTSGSGVRGDVPSVAESQRAAAAFTAPEDPEDMRAEHTLA
jgi:hypothetical protein